MAKQIRSTLDFLREIGWENCTRNKLPNDASFRNYERLELNGETAILMDATHPSEDIQPFSQIAYHLLKLGYSAPRILAEDRKSGFMLLEDLGPGTFSKILRSRENEHFLYKLATDFLIEFHEHADVVIPKRIECYNEEILLAEVNLFLDWYLPNILDNALPEKSKTEYVSAWKKVLPYGLNVPKTLVLRDFHVDNLIYLPERAGIGACGLLDFQDAVKGPITYDLVSLLEDARRDISSELVDEMLEHYVSSFNNFSRVDFFTSMAVLGAQRHTKVIGIFTRLSQRDRKSNYLIHIPRVWQMLENACMHPALFPLKSWLDTNIPSHLRCVPKTRSIR